jgi:branched-subunit amino acid ABC-type transport system permease component
MAVLSGLLHGDVTLAIALAFTVTAAVAFACHRAIYRPMRRRGATMYTIVLASFALGLTIRYILLVWAGSAGMLQVKPQIPLTVAFTIGETPVLSVFVWSLPTAILLVLLLHFLLHRTKVGKMMRAVANNPTLSLVTGIDLEKVHDFTWIMAGGLAGIAGSLWAILYYATPYLGWIALLSVFAAVVLGGLTSFTGAIAGGFIIGLSENVLMETLNRLTGLEFTYKPIISFAIIVIVLMARPTGLTGSLASRIAHAAPRFHNREDRT